MALLAVVLVGLAGCAERQVRAGQPAPPPVAPTSAPPRPASPSLPTDKWELRVYGMKTAIFDASPDRAPRADRMARAEKDLLQDGKAQARTGVGHLLDNTAPETPKHLFAAFVLAYADLDYQRGREVLLRYQRAWGGARRNQRSVDRVPLRDHDPQDVFSIGGEDVPSVLYELYAKRKDPLILREMMEARPWSDASGTTCLDGSLERALRLDAHAFLVELSSRDRKVQEKVCRGLGADVSDQIAEKSRSALQTEAARKGSEYAALARQALKWMEEERKRWSRPQGQ